jgi:putative copper export protein
MDQWLIISLRVIHILTGAAWVGGAFLLMGFITRTARRDGLREGRPYLNRFLDHPFFSVYITAAEGLAVLSGGVLFWNASNGLQSEWIGSPMGSGFSIGAAAAILALGTSLPISKNLSEIYYLVAADQQPTDSSARYNGLHRRLALLGNVYMALLAIAVAGMASANYLN